jgi:hypothetical protein
VAREREITHYVNSYRRTKPRPTRASAPFSLRGSDACKCALVVRRSFIGASVSCAQQVAFFLRGRSTRRPCHANISVSRVAVLAAAVSPSPHRFPCTPPFSPLPFAPVPASSGCCSSSNPHPLRCSSRPTWVPRSLGPPRARLVVQAWALEPMEANLEQNCHISSDCLGTPVVSASNTQVQVHSYECHSSGYLTYVQNFLFQ